MAKVIPIIPGGTVGESNLTDQVFPLNGHLLEHQPKRYGAEVVYHPPVQRFYREFDDGQEALAWAASIRDQIKAVE